MISLKQSCNQIQEISCVPNTPNTMANCIGALVRWRDGDKSVILMVEIYFYNPNKEYKSGQLIENFDELLKYSPLVKSFIDIIEDV